MNASSGFYYSGDGTIKNLATGETTYTHEQALKLANGREVFSGFVYNGQGEIINIDSLKNSSGGNGVTKEYVDDCDTEIKEELKKKVDSSTLENYVQKESGKALFSGSYSDLKDKPTKLSQFTNDSGYAVSSSLATVSKTGSYNDLKDKPTTISNADTVDGKHASEFFRYTDLGSKETDVNSILATGIYKCTNFKNYPSSCVDSQGTLQVINYANSNSENINKTMGVDNLWLKQYYTEPHYGKTYERYINCSTINPWVLVGGEFNDKSLKNPTSTTHSDWSGNDTTGNIVPTMNMFAYWNGAYNSNNASNLLYCSKGAFGDIVTKSASEYATSNHNHYAGTIEPCAIEIGRNMNGNGGYIDFHYNNSSADYTSRIIESSNGLLEIVKQLKIDSKYPLLADTTAINTFANYYTAGSNRLIVDINGTKLKIMWGRVNTETKSIQTIVFPSEFSGVPMVFIEQSYPTGNNAQGVSIKTKSKSNFSIQRNRRSYYTDSVDEEFYYIDWFAIGI